MAVDPDEEWRSDEERAARIEHLEYVPDCAIGPKHVLEDLFGNDDVEFLFKHTGADVVFRITYGNIAGKAKVFPCETADFEHGGVLKIQLANKASRFLVHDNAKPHFITVRMQLRPGELVGFLQPGHALEL
jgi:hypothetical protein